MMARLCPSKKKVTLYTEMKSGEYFEKDNIYEVNFESGIYIPIHGIYILPSNVSQCTSTSDSQELALNCTVHKISHTVFTINHLIPIII